MPSRLVTFYTTLIGAFNYRRRKNERNIRLVKSFASDAVYAVRNGAVNPSKQITLASTVKSLTNSKKIINILHKFGHICSYDTIEGLETEGTYMIIMNSQLSASDMVLREGLKPGVAFDNFDRNIESRKEPKVMHDTVGISIQDITTDNMDVPHNDSDTEPNNDEMDEATEQSMNSQGIEDSSNSNLSNSSSNAKKKRRTFEGILLDVPSYTKKPKLVETIQPYNIHERLTEPDNLDKVKKIDILWMLSHYLKIRTPMWVGFISKLFTDNSIKQLLRNLTKNMLKLHTTWALLK